MKRNNATNGGVAAYDNLPPNAITGSFWFDPVLKQFHVVPDNVAETTEFEEVMKANTVVGVPMGGTGLSSFTKGDILVATDADTLTVMSPPTNNRILVSDDSEPTGWKFVDVATLGGGNITPDPPTNPYTDDLNNQFDFDTNPDFNLYSFYEYTLDGGATVEGDCTGKPQDIPDANFAVGQVGVRVKADTGRNASAWLFNTIQFTASGSGGGAVTFQNADGFDVSSNSVSRNNSGSYVGTVDTVETIAADGEFTFIFNSVRTSLQIIFDDGTRQYEIRPFSSTGASLYLNNGYVDDLAGGGSVLDNTSVFKIARASGVVTVHKGATLLYTFGTASSGAAQLIVKAANEAENQAAGINSVQYA